MRIIIILTLISVQGFGQCVIDGTTFVGPGTKTTHAKACSLTVTGINGIPKFNGTSAATLAEAGTDYSTPSSLSDSLDSYMPLAGTVLSNNFNLLTDGNSFNVYGDASPLSEPYSRMSVGGSFATLGWSLTAFSAYNFTATSSGLSMGYTDSDPSESTIRISNSAMTVTDNQSSKGLYYAADYSSGSTDRWLADKGYINSGTATLTNKTWNGVVIGSSYGGAGTVNGILKANGSGTVSAAVSGADYQYPLKRYNVVEYGAVGNGSTDNTTAFAAARDAAGVGGVVIVPAGTYIQNTLTLNLSRQTWIIDPAATIKISNGSTTSVIVVSADSVTLTGGGTIDGNESNISNAGVAGIYTASSSATNLLLDNIKIQNTEGYGVQAFGSSTIVRNCKFYNCGTTSGGASALIITPNGSNLYDITVEGNEIDNSMMPAATYNDSMLYVVGSPRSGLTYTYKVYKAKIINNTVKGPLDPQGAGGGAICITVGSEGAIVQGNETSGGSMGVSVDGCNNVKVVGNTFNGANWYGIELANANYCEVIGNTVNGQGLTGKTLSSGGGSLVVADGTTSNYLTISNNILDSVYATSSNVISINTGKEHTITNNLVKCYGSSSGIVTTVPGCVISGNTVKGSSQSAGQTAIKFINVYKPGVINNNVIRDCNRAISMFATGGTVDSITISGNSITSTNTHLYTNLSGGAVFGNQIKIVGNTGITDYIDYNASTPFGNAQTANPLSQFAATTSSQLAGVISDETGSGSAMFGTSPTITSGVTLSGNISANAWTTSGVALKIPAATYTDLTSSGTVASNYAHLIGVPTFAASSATTYTNAYNVFLASPAAGTNVTNTTGWSLGTQGNIQIGGAIQLSNAGTNTGISAPSATYLRIQTGASNLERVKIAGSTGLIGVGPTAPTPTAHFHIAANTTSNSAFRIEESATDPSSPNAGDVWNNAGLIKQRTGGVTYIIAKTLTNTATLDFGSTAAGAATDLTMTVTGAVSGDVCAVGVPTGSSPTNGAFSCWVSAADTVTVRFINPDVLNSMDPASGTFRVSVIKY